MDITLDFIDPTNGETLEITVAWQQTTAAIAYYERRGWSLL